MLLWTKHYEEVGAMEAHYMASGSTSETEWNIEYNLHLWKKFSEMLKEKE